MKNKVNLIGNLGKDPEIVNLDSGVKIAKFSLVTSETYKNKQGERVSETEWHNIVIFGKLAEIVEKYVSKGSKVDVEGKIKTRSWEKDGEKKYATDIIVNELVMLDSKPSSTSEQSAAYNTSSNNEHDDLAF